MTDFAAWYALYPRKVGRGAAEKAWRRLTAPDRLLALSSLPAHVERWRLHATTWEYIPHPATWLNGQRYADEFPNNGAVARMEAHRIVDPKAAGSNPACPAIKGATAHAESRTQAQPRAEVANPPVAPPTLTLVDPGFRSSAGPVSLRDVIAPLRAAIAKRSAK